MLEVLQAKTDIRGGALGEKNKRLKPKPWLRFETLLADISTRFVNLSPDRVDAEIVSAQRLICEALDLDRSSLGQVSKNELRRCGSRTFISLPTRRLSPRRSLT